MKIIFDYHPVKLTTRFVVNNNIRSDLFGELGTVSRYPLQSWLWKRGSWMGIEKALQDIARNRKIEITFIGRKIDFIDFERAINGIEKTMLHFQPAYEETFSIQNGLDEISRYMKNHPDVSIRKEFEQISHPESSEQFLKVETMEQYYENRGCIKSGRLVLLLNADVFRIIQSDLKTMLCENFMRPEESIVVLARDLQEETMFTEELDGTGISIAKEYDAKEYDELMKHLIEKYSVPEMISKEAKIRENLESFFEILKERYEYAKEINRKIHIHTLPGMIANEEEDDCIYEKNLKEIRWFEKHRQDIVDYFRTLEKEI